MNLYDFISRTKDYLHQMVLKKIQKNRRLGLDTLLSAGVLCAAGGKKWLEVGF
ncbi:MAG: hypothetical protein ACR2GW_07580 [Pyrinomonadaceae bacterium]